MLVNRGMGGGLNAPGFWLELADAGAGIVNTTPSLASGSPTATFTRATTAWTKLSSGLWASVASGSARSCYFGLTTAVGSYAGYLAEGSRTQLVTPTASIRDMTDASWIKVTMTTAKTATGIDGVINSATTLTAAGANSTILQTLVAAATSRTYSCWVKRRTGTGTIILKQGTATLDITALINSSTYTLVQLNDNELNVAYGIQINTSTDAIDVDFNQFEAGTFASSPLDTAAGTRNADVLTYPFTGNTSATSGTCYAEIVCYGFNPVTGRVIGTTTISGTTLAVSVSGAPQSFDGTSTIASTVFSLNAAVKVASSWGSGRSITRNGIAATTGAYDGSFGMTDIAIGTGQPTAELFGTVKNVRIWPNQLADSQLVSITA